MGYCVDCQHLRRAGPSNIWYDLYCAQAPREAAVDPVTGEAGFKATNDLGRALVVPESLEHCRDVRETSACQYAEAKVG